MDYKRAKKAKGDIKSGRGQKTKKPLVSGRMRGGRHIRK